MKVYRVTYEPGYRPAGKYKVGQNTEICTKASLSQRLSVTRYVLEARSRGRENTRPVVTKVEEIELPDNAWQDVTGAMLGGL